MESFGDVAWFIFGITNPSPQTSYLSVQTIDSNLQLCEYVVDGDGVHHYGALYAILINSMNLLTVRRDESRVLAFTTEILPFKFHSLCSKVRLQHLMFADDLLLFSRGDQQSVMVLLRSFATFSAASGLQMNKQKSNIYFSGVQWPIKDYIISISGCVEGQLPFKYLGVPITAGKLRKADCQLLIEKIVERIRSFGAWKISYAGRVVLVKSVGSPHNEGGLGIRFSFDWNRATVGKLVWWLYYKPDSLWVKWVHQIYMKGGSWANHSPKAHMSGNWKAICKVRDLFQSGYTDGKWLAGNDGYTVASGYEWLRPKRQQVGWARPIWKSWALPKHKFLAWLMLKNTLNVKAKLFKYGICADDVCCICHIDQETISHVFQNCRYAILVMEGVCEWLHIPVPTVNGIIWVGRRKWSPLMNNICLAALMAVYYSLWQQRNKSRLEGVSARPSVIIQQIQTCIRSRWLHPKLVLVMMLIGLLHYVEVYLNYMY
ncbi:uncharacterized protein LOC141641206 [Silene latifolia]|uniref:uncharacterized protein LOC141641206 n=1 Tax=Silene latifolia TaxID=37657 RepID=UPI003D77D6C5